MTEDVVDAADAGMRHLLRDVHLALEALDRSGLLGDLGTDRLQRDRAGELHILGLVHLAHPALRDEPNYPEPAGEYVAWRERVG